jgi:hypothetical protein
MTKGAVPMTVPRIAALCAAVPLFLLGATSPAAAEEPAASVQEPPISLSMTMAGVADEASDSADVERRATLECLPAGGTHPAPAESCRTRNQVGGGLAALRV